MSNQDTQFQGFAKLLLKKLFAAEDIWIDTITPDWEAEWERIIAQGAHALVEHTMLNVSMADLDMLSQEECVERIPDLTQWPEREESQS